MIAYVKDGLVSYNNTKGSEMRSGVSIIVNL